MLAVTASACPHSGHCVLFPLKPLPTHNIAQSKPLQEHRSCYSSRLLVLFKRINVLQLCDGCRCCWRGVRKCREALMTECPRPCLWRETGLIDALMLGADVSMLKCSQRSGVCGGAWLPLAHAAAARVPPQLCGWGCSNVAVMRVEINADSSHWLSVSLVLLGCMVMSVVYWYSMNDAFSLIDSFSLMSLH